MAIFSPKRWTRQPQTRVQVDPVWLANGLNLALIPSGAGFVDCSPRNIVGTGGVRTNGTCQLGRTVSRTSGNYAFRGLLSNFANGFSILAVVKPTNITDENVIAISNDSAVLEAIQFTIFNSQIDLIWANRAILASSIGSGLAVGKTSVIGLTCTYNTEALEVGFYADGRFLNTVDVSTRDAVFVSGTSGQLFVKQSGSNPYTGGLGFLADFSRALSREQMCSLTANPWQVFISKPDFYYVEDVASGITGTIAVTLANDTSAITGTSTIVGTSATTNANDTSSISGDVGVAITGTIAYTNADDTSAITGTTTVTGTSATTNANDTFTGTGTTTVTGTTATTNANDTFSASGVAGNITGTIDVTNANDTFAGQGSTPSPTPVNPNLGGGGSGYDPQQQIKANKSIRRLLEKAYNKIEPEEVQVELKEAVIAEAIQEIQEQVIEDLSAVYMVELIQQIEQRMLKQRNDELAAIILLLD